MSEHNRVKGWQPHPPFDTRPRPQLADYVTDEMMDSIVPGRLPDGCLNELLQTLAAAPRLDDETISPGPAMRAAASMQVDY